MKPKSKSKTTIREKSIKDTPEKTRLAGVVFEDFSSQMKVFNEAFELMGKEITKNIRVELDGLRMKMDDGFLAADARGYKMEKRIDAFYKEFKEETQGLRIELKDTRESLSGRIDSVHQELKDTREELSEKIDCIIEKEQTQDVQIKELQLRL